MESCLAIAEPAREELKQRLLKATQYNSAEEVERGVCALEHMMHSRCMKMPTDDPSIQSWNIGWHLLHRSAGREVHAARQRS